MDLITHDDVEEILPDPPEGLFWRIKSISSLTSELQLIDPNYKPDWYRFFFVSREKVVQYGYFEPHYSKYILDERLNYVAESVLRSYKSKELAQSGRISGDYKKDRK